MKKFLIQFLLFIVASVLGIFFGIVASLYSIGSGVKKRGFSNIFLTLALLIDINGNVVCEELFNDKLRITGGYAFGRSGETISSVLGKNQRDGTLTKSGNILANILDWIDKDHCKNSIDESLS